MLLAAGKGQSLTLAGSLRMWGYRVERRVVYAAMPVPVLPEAAVRLLLGLVAAPATRRDLAGLGGASADVAEPGAAGAGSCPRSPDGAAPGDPVEPGHDEVAWTGRDEPRTGHDQAETGHRENHMPSSCAVLFFSSETAHCFMRLVRAAGLENALPHCEAVTIGRPAAMALETGGWSRVRVARRPNQDEMLALLR